MTAEPLTTDKVEVEEREATSTPWRVVVSNDPINLFTVVTAVFQSVLQVSHEVALEYTRKVHFEGRCIVFHGGQEECQGIAEQLMAHQLWTHVEKGD